MLQLDLQEPQLILFSLPLLHQDLAVSKYLILNTRIKNIQDELLKSDKIFLFISDISHEVKSLDIISEREA